MKLSKFQEGWLWGIITGVAIMQIVEILARGW